MLHSVLLAAVLCDYYCANRMHYCKIRSFCLHIDFFFHKLGKNRVGGSVKLKIKFLLPESVYQTKLNCKSIPITNPKDKIKSYFAYYHSQEISKVKRSCSCISISLIHVFVNLKHICSAILRFGNEMTKYYVHVYSK